MQISSAEASSMRWQKLQQRLFGPLLAKRATAKIRVRQLPAAPALFDVGNSGVNMFAPLGMLPVVMSGGKC